ncbi:MAG TPA: hypothetical protein VFP61_06140 [Acidimicrobiales bacterium]|nr:hypothetical protein [Acidimicrobiales bacterium]
MTTVHPVTRRPQPPAPPAGEQAGPDPDAGVPAPQAEPLAEGPDPRRLRREQLALVAVLVAVLAATLGLLAMQWLTAAPATSAVPVAFGGGST